MGDSRGTPDVKKGGTTLLKTQEGEKKGRRPETRLEGGGRLRTRDIVVKK